MMVETLVCFHGSKYQIFHKKIVHSSLLSTELHLCYGDSSILYPISEFRLQFFVVLRSYFSKCNWLRGF